MRMVADHAPMLDDKMDREAVADALLADLTVEQAWVVRMRYFHGKTLDQVGSLLRGGKQRERVRQIEAAAIRRMQRRIHVLFPSYAQIIAQEDDSRTRRCIDALLWTELVSYLDPLPDDDEEYIE